MTIEALMEKLQGFVKVSNGRLSLNVTKGIERIQLDTNQTRRQIEDKCGLDHGFLKGCMITNKILTRDLNRICQEYGINPTVGAEYMEEDTN